MNARPMRCSSGPHRSTGIRLEPACAATARTSARSTADGSSTSSPGSSPAVTRTPCSSSSSETMRTSAMSGMLRNRLGVGPEQRGDHGLRDQVLGTADGELANQRRTALDQEDVVDHASSSVCDPRCGRRGWAGVPFVR